jgi:hypothetical protein
MPLNRAGQRSSTVPGWLKLAAVGVVTVALGQLAPPSPHPIPTVAGVLMVFVAVIWGRQWAAQVVRAEAKRYDEEHRTDRHH